MEIDKEEAKNGGTRRGIAGRQKQTAREAGPLSPYRQSEIFATLILVGGALRLVRSLDPGRALSLAREQKRGEPLSKRAALPVKTIDAIAEKMTQANQTGLPAAGSAPGAGRIFSDGSRAQTSRGSATLLSHPIRLRPLAYCCQRRT